MPRGWRVGRKIVDPLPAMIAFYNAWFSRSQHKASFQAAFVRGLVENAGWNHRHAQSHFKSHSGFEIGDALGFVRAEALRLSQRYPRIVVAPLFYSVVDRALYQVAP